METTQVKFLFLPFLLSFTFGIIYIYFVNNHEEKIVKTPTPFSNNLYSDFDGECYKVKVLETECTGNEQEFTLAI